MSTVEDPVALWLRFKRVGEVNRARILGAVIEHSPVTEPELTVLVHLDSAGGSMRQNALASAAGWDRTRLSHLLTRMEERGQLQRQRLRNGVDVTLLGAGRDTLEATRAPLQAAVQQYFVGRLTPEQLAALDTIVQALND